jgi:wobble nucleotide-excising tRNase
MIKSLTINGQVAFGNSPTILSDLLKINFVFGANATGKTTISRIIANESQYPTCIVEWEAGLKLEPLVYNRDFIERNFGRDAELKGVFTLGEHNKATLEAIEKAKQEIDAIQLQTKTNRITLEGLDGRSGLKSDLESEEAKFVEECWSLKLRHDEKLKGAFEHLRGSKKTFKDRVLHEEKNNNSVLRKLTELEKKAESAFAENKVAIAELQIPSFSGLLASESDRILTKVVVGSSDVDIAAMIDKLGNSDWVKAGRVYFDKNDNVCPFCQQSTPVSLKSSLERYFDETFQNDIDAISRVLNEYRLQSGNLQAELGRLLENPSRFLDAQLLETEKKILDGKIRVNLQAIGGKLKQPSSKVTLDSLAEVLNRIKKALEDANTAIKEHNDLIANRGKEKVKLTGEVWRYLLDQEFKSNLTSYHTSKDALDKAINALTEKIADHEKQSRRKEAELRELEKTITSIQPTIDGINAILNSFGFKNFHLAKSTKEQYYKIQRIDGSDAKSTLSEGESSFISFLYFYFLLKGSTAESGVTQDRVVVFDDPVSSLDSDVLFIVSSLIKETFERARERDGQIKQVFVLTHNVYFHKEVTFNKVRSGDGTALKDETFWIIRRVNAHSSAEKHGTNPVQTSYQLLWSEVKNPNPNSSTLPNTLRRILENYFKILGNRDFDKICSHFAGNDRLICRSLFSWVNAGSHGLEEDLYVTLGPSAIDNYLRVFQLIFKNEEHIAHYNMMMGIGAP